MTRPPLDSWPEIIADKEETIELLKARIAMQLETIQRLTAENKRLRNVILEQAHDR